LTHWQEPAPGEHEAGQRGWEMVRSAFEERLPSPRRRDWRAFVLAAAAAAAIAAALTPAGHAVFDAVRGEKNAKPALFSLPVPTSRLLVNSAEGAWVVQADGSKRLLESYREASWSPHGLYLAAIRGDEVRALEPNGDVHWSIGRSGLAGPVWSNHGGGDERVAYLSGSILRVIGGDGRGDRALAQHATRVAPAWRPKTHVVAYVDGTGKVVVRDADTRRVLWTATAQQRPVALQWSGDGQVLLARGPSSITVFGRNGRQVLRPLGGPSVAPVVDAAFMPGSHALAFVQSEGGRSVLWFYPRLRPDATAARRVFAGAGRFDRIAWSPDGRWILLSWQSADQWLFIRSAAVRKVIPVSGITDAFGPAAAPAGWCCP
jgi:hypothetical protein